MRAESILSLSERLHQHAKKLANWRQHNTAADLRLASFYLKRLAA